MTTDEATAIVGEPAVSPVGATGDVDERRPRFFGVGVTRAVLVLVYLITDRPDLARPGFGLTLKDANAARFRTA